MARVTSTVGKASRPDVWLQSVACASARACTAVGVFDANRLALSLGNGVPVAERWNGRQWSLQRMPDVPNGKPDQLSISCPSQSECFVVGSVITSSIDSYPRVEVPLVERWSNGAWSIQRMPTPHDVSLPEVRLADVSCGAASVCMAVGSVGTVASPLAERWDGRRWSVQRLAGRAQGTLSAASCTSKRACIAVGDGGNRGYAEDWNGSRWSRASLPTKGYLSAAAGGSISGLSCTSMTACMAVGAWGDYLSIGEPGPTTVHKRSPGVALERQALVTAGAK